MRQPSKFQQETQRHAHLLHDLSARRVFTEFHASTQHGITGYWTVQVEKSCCPDGVTDITVRGPDLIDCLSTARRARGAV